MELGGKIGISKKNYSSSCATPMSSKISTPSSSSFLKTVYLEDWWLFRSGSICDGKNLSIG
ncbi:hypothetical protein GIB67_024963, partial [Kingdonia uniflora]